MNRIRKIATSVVFAAFAAVLMTAPTFAQTPSSSSTGAPQPFAVPPKVEPGFCAPWHSCVAKAVGAAFVLYLLATAGMFMYQRRGFNKIEPKQGHPRGVPVQKK